MESRCVVKSSAKRRTQINEEVNIIRIKQVLDNDGMEDDFIHCLKRDNLAKLKDKS